MDEILIGEIFFERRCALMILRRGFINIFMKTLLTRSRRVRETLNREKRLCTDNEINRILKYVNAYHMAFPITEVITRGNSADHIFGEWARQNNIPLKEFVGGHIHRRPARNVAMCNYAENGLIFWDEFALIIRDIIDHSNSIGKQFKIFSIFDLIDNPSF